MRNLVFIWAGLFLNNPCAAGTITINDDRSRWLSMSQACQAYRLDHQKKGKNVGKYIFGVLLLALAIHPKKFGKTL